MPSIASISSTAILLRWQRIGVCFFPGRALLVILGILAAMVPFVVHAHGGGAPQLTNAEAGPYRLFAWTQPEPWRVGEVHVSIGVTLPPAADIIVDEGVSNNTLDTPVTDALVTVTLTPMNGNKEPMTVDALPLAQLGSLYYEADAEVATAGDWQVTVDVTGPEGSGRADFVTEVLPARSSKTLYLLGGAVIAVLALAGLIGMRRGQTQNQKAR